MITLSQQQLAQYRNEGFLVLSAHEHKCLVDPSVLQQWSDEVREWPLTESKGKWMPYFEDRSDGTRQIMRTERFMEYHDGFKALLDGDALTGILKQLNGQVRNDLRASS